MGLVVSERCEVLDKRKVAALTALIPLLALALTGLSLAHWDDEVDLQGSVSMGTFNVQMSLDSFDDNEGSLDVGTIQASLQDNSDGDDPLDGGASDLLTVTIGNMYPGYKACVTFDIHNAGTIPAEVSSDAFTINIETDSFDWDTYGEYFIIDLYYTGNDTVTPGSPVEILHSGTDTGGSQQTTYDFGSDEYEILYLSAGEHEYFMLCIGLSEDPNAPEQLMGTSFDFSMAFNWVQAVPTVSGGGE